MKKTLAIHVLLMLLILGVVPHLRAQEARKRRAPLVMNSRPLIR